MIATYYSNGQISSNKLPDLIDKHSLSFIVSPVYTKDKYFSGLFRESLVGVLYNTKVSKRLFINVGALYELKLSETRYLDLSIYFQSRHKLINNSLSIDIIGGIDNSWFFLSVYRPILVPTNISKRTSLEIGGIHILSGIGLNYRLGRRFVLAIQPIFKYNLITNYRLIDAYNINIRLLMTYQLYKKQ